VKERKKRCWKVRKEKWSMVVGKYMEIGDIPELLVRVVVGRFYGNIFSANALISWMDEN
jgi:hypothetical protein